MRLTSCSPHCSSSIGAPRWGRTGCGCSSSATPTRAPDAAALDEFERSPGAVLRDMVGGGVSLPWNLAMATLIGLSLLFTRLTFGATGSMANADHLIGALILTTISVAAAEVARPVRFLNVLFGLALIAMPFLYDAGTASMVNGIACGLALVALSIPRGRIRERYGPWQRLIV